MIKNLVFEGGGVKGIAFGGALIKMHNLGFLSNIEKVAGTSAGAITAVLLAMKYDPYELKEIIAKTNFNDFADDDIGVLRDAVRFFSKYGIHKGDKFYKWMKKLIEKKACSENVTFRYLKENNFLDLSLVGTNLTKQRAEIYSYNTTPDMEVALAARISMSIPFYFQCVELDGDILVDGGATWNYPISIFDDGFVNRETLGLRLDTSEEITLNKLGWKNLEKKIDNIADYSLSLVGFLMESANKRHLKKEDKNRTIFIDTLDVGTVDFDLPDSKINELLASGEKAIENYFT